MLRLRDAQQLCKEVLLHGETLKCAPLSVVVLDKGGHILCAMREEESGILRFDVAYGKAWGALGMGFGTRTFSRLTEEPGTMQSFVHALTSVSGGKVIPTRGGVLVRNTNGDLLGAIGVSGDIPTQDEACILHAISKLKWVAQP